MWTHHSTVPGSPCFKPSSPGNTCLGEEATRQFQPPASGQPSHSNLSKWDPRSPFYVPYCFLTHSICEHNNMIAILPPQSLGSFVTQHSTRTPTTSSAHVAQTCPESTSQSTSILTTGFPSGSVVKNPPASAGDTGDVGLIPRSGRLPWRRKWQPLQCSCLENPMEPGRVQSEGCKESDMTEYTCIHTYMHTTQLWILCQSEYKLSILTLTQLYTNILLIVIFFCIYFQNVFVKPFYYRGMFSFFSIINMPS